MSKIIKSSNSRQPVEIKEEGGFTFYRPKFKRDWFVSGPDICRVFGHKNPNQASKRMWSANEEFLDDNSCVIEIPTKTAKTKKKGVPFKGTPFDTKNTQKVRCYNRSGAWFFTSLLRTKDAKMFIKVLFDSFDKILRSKEPKPLEWQTAREEGKKQRRDLTDAIQLFVEYATTQGSKSPDTYYIHFTKKINKLLFDVHGKGTPDNFRSSLNTEELAILGIVEERIANYLLSCMDVGIYYKDVYKTIDPILFNAKQVLNFKTLTLIGDQQ